MAGFVMLIGFLPHRYDFSKIIISHFGVIWQVVLVRYHIHI